MRYSYIRLFAAAAIAFACDAFIVMAQTPIANLPLTCPNAANIGQPQNNCSNLVYQLPNSDQHIVLSSNGTWARAVNLAATDTLTVCALPVAPGAYSSCRDAAGVRRLVQLPKSQVFTSSPPPPPPPVSGARIIDLTRSPLEITEAGAYVFDRSWVGSIVITADTVTLDLRGFELRGDVAIQSTGGNVTIRDGVVEGDIAAAINASGVSTVIDKIRARAGRGHVIRLSGAGSVLSNSVVSIGTDGTAVSAGDDVTIRNNVISSRFIPLAVGSRTKILDNELQCPLAGDPCIRVEGTGNLISRNRIKDRTGNASGIVIIGDHNWVLDNFLIPGCSVASGTAIIVQGRGNILRDNLAPSCTGIVGWATGIVFSQDGNFYGDNIVWATLPFDVGATVQTDLGGNVGFSN